MVCGGEVEAEEFDEAVLGNSKCNLSTMTTTTRFGFLSEFHIHFLDAFIEETGIVAGVAVANHVVEGIKN